MGRKRFTKLTTIENGCNLWDNCLTCPFPDCIVKEKDLVKAPKAKARAIELKEEGYSPEEIAKELGKPIRVVKRWLGIEEKSQ